MNKSTKTNILLLLIILILVGFACFCNLPKSNISNNNISLFNLVLYDIRLPRVLLALIAGAVFGIAGNTMQGIFRNPLASPGLLGSSSGATVASVFILYFTSSSTVILLFGGVLGSLLALGLIYIIAINQNSSVLILAGVAINSLLASGIALLLSNAKSPWALSELYNWLQGSLKLANMQTILISLILIILGLVLIYSQRKLIDVLTLGEETAITLGINIKKSMIITAIGISLIIGAVIPQTGVIGFVGLIAPHFARITTKNKPSKLYLTSALYGGLLMLCADLLIWRTDIFSKVHIGTLTSFIGAPFLIFILFQFYKRSGYK